jgi:hypothetical protein
MPTTAPTSAAYGDTAVVAGKKLLQGLGEPEPCSSLPKGSTAGNTQLLITGDILSGKNHCGMGGPGGLPLMLEERPRARRKERLPKAGHLNARLCTAESRKPGFLDYKSSVHAPSGLRRRPSF